MKTTLVVLILLAVAFALFRIGTLPGSADGDAGEWSANFGCIAVILAGAAAIGFVLWGCHE
jgi:hypothetical protein